MDSIRGPEQGDAIDQKLEELKSQHLAQGAPAPVEIGAMPQSGSVARPIPPTDLLEPEKQSLKRPIGITLIVVSLITAGLFALEHFGQKPSSGAQLDASTKYGAQDSPEPALTAKLSSVSQSNTLTVNGLLSVTGSLVLSPTVQPPAAVAGELYYDSSKNLLGYYNGTTFVYPQGGGSVTNNTINNITNPAVTNNLTNVTNVTNVTGGGMTGTGTAGQLAMFTGASALGDSLINQNGTSLNTGAGVESVALGSVAGTSDTTLQGGTGGVTINTGTGAQTTGAVSINTGASTSSTGGITIQSGDSSTTAAGNIDIDTGASVLNGTVVSDKTFENGTDLVCDNIYGDNTSVAQSTAEAHTGTHSLAVTVGSNFFPEWGVGDGCQNPPFVIPVTAGHTYAFEAWVTAGTTSTSITASAIWSNDGYAGGGEISQQNFGSVTDISSGWRKVEGILTAPVGAVSMGIEFVSFNATTIGEVHYFDDITVTDLSSSSATASINLGATNAQEITIGNSGMLAATSIYGGGINLDGGTGILSMSAGTITAASGGATYSTTSGALDLTSAATALWKVNGSGGTGYDLNLQAGDAGGINSANGGNLYLQGGAGAAGGSGGDVIVKPQADSPGAFQVQNAGGANIINVDTQTQLVNDPMIANAPTGTLSDSAAWVNGQYLELNNGARTDGQVNYLVTPGNSFDASFNFWAASGADSTYLYADNTSVPTGNLGYATTSGGYIFNYDEFHGDVEVWFNGTELASSPVSGIGSSTWHTAEVIKNGDALTMKMDGSTVLSFTDIPRVLSGDNFGIGGYSGAFAGEHRTDDFILSDGSAPAILTVAATAQFNSDLNVAGTISTPNLTVQAAVVTATLTVNGHIISGGTAITTFSSGVGACSGGGSVGVTGNDVSGSASITTGTAPCSLAGSLINVTFTTPYTSTPHVVITPSEPNASTLQYYVSVSPSGFTIKTNSANLVAGQTYNFSYIVVQ